MANWLIGREIVEEEQKGHAKAGYGDNLMRALASKLAEEFGDGYGLTNLKMIRKFYLTYHELVDLAKGHSPRDLSSEAHGAIAAGKGHALRDKSDAARRKTTAALLPEIRYVVRGEWNDTVSMPLPVIPHAVSAKSWKPGRLHPNLSWTHYRTLLRVEKLYVNYYDRERRTKGDNPTLGLILCADKNDAVVRYTLGPDQQRKIFASRYKLHLPSEAELRAELRREVKALAAPKKHGDAQ